VRNLFYRFLKIFLALRKNTSYIWRKMRLKLRTNKKSPEGQESKMEKMYYFLICTAIGQKNATGIYPGGDYLVSGNLESEEGRKTLSEALVDVNLYSVNDLKVEYFPNDDAAWRRHTELASEF